MKVKGNKFRSDRSWEKLGADLIFFALTGRIVRLSGVRIKENGIV